LGLNQGFYSLSQIEFLLLVDLDKQYMKVYVGKMVDHMIWGSCIPTHFVKSGDDCSSLVHNIGTGAYINSDKANRHTWLVRVIKYQVGNIQDKRCRDEVWITICIRIIIIHITNMLKAKTNK